MIVPTNTASTVPSKHFTLRKLFFRPIRRKVTSSVDTDLGRSNIIRAQQDEAVRYRIFAITLAFRRTGLKFTCLTNNVPHKSQTETGVLEKEQV